MGGNGPPGRAFATLTAIHGGRIRWCSKDWLPQQAGVTVTVPGTVAVVAASSAATGASTGIRRTLKASGTSQASFVEAPQKRIFEFVCENNRDYRVLFGERK